MTSRLPIPGSDLGTWGTILNDYLSQSLNADGSSKLFLNRVSPTLSSDLASKATDSTVVHLSGSETITGARTLRVGRLSMAPTLLLPGDLQTE